MRKITRKRPGLQQIREWRKNKERDKKAILDGGDGRSGYLYIFKIGDNLYKIGMTTNIKKRIKALSASCPSLQCIWTARVRDRIFAEQDLHKAFESQKLEREVYTLVMPADMIRADQIADKYR